MSKTSQHLLCLWVNNVTNGLYSPQNEVMLAIWHKFKQYDIEISFPQQDVCIKTEKARNTAAGQISTGGVR